MGHTQDVTVVNGNENLVKKDTHFPRMDKVFHTGPYIFNCTYLTSESIDGENGDSMRICIH